jgi:hypothetical protein
MDIQVAIEIKKRKLAFELNKQNPNPHIVKRLEDAIKRHKGEATMMKYRRKHR